MIQATTILTKADRAIEAVWDAFASTLPEAPASGVCECGGSDWSMYEFGYGRSTSMEFTDHWHGYTGGYDDFTEDGLFGLLICNGCDKAHQQPDEIHYD
jgi:hypothetical protein